jgi:tetratricopeptide (TPR) repeat protein
MHANNKYLDLKKSTYYFEKALRINPYDTDCLENLTIIYYNSGNNSAAKAKLLRLYNLLPNNFTANKGLGTIYWLEGDYKKALTYYEKSMSLYQDDDDLNSKYALNLMKVSTDNYSTALVYAKKAVELNPNSGDNLFILAQIYIFEKNYTRGKEYYEKALALKPSIKDPIVEQELENLLKNY